MHTQNETEPQVAKVFNNAVAIQCAGYSTKRFVVVALERRDLEGFVQYRNDFVKVAAERDDRIIMFWS
ncbi:hypothetical protein Ngar_c30240 [Candidatus Nitrososphaera gargensis Ga9.2]|uniref:Uncharacterized protein n=1 Tax=Nitrososphaera gargensis (strain Ga9.2) TaxID=1237085 RepID=K0IIY0_NITGG|nr:hypothetical protein Ngar_c30240 [Candidatus Nitrososphaera gargensis Ga9.2]